MANIVFYKDSPETFECDIRIEGASSSNTKARLILDFADKILMFRGKIDGSKVTIPIPKLSEVNSVGGVATLEVIADGAYFESWESTFELKNKKAVAVSEVRINRDAKIIVERVSKKTEPQIRQTAPKSKLLRESCSPGSVDFVKQTFSKFSRLSAEQKVTVTRAMKQYKPPKNIVEWASKVFVDPTQPYAKYCMYELQRGFEKKR